VKLRVITILGVLAAAGIVRAQSAIGVGQVYVGANGVAVTVVPSSTGDRKILVAVAGTGSVFDGKVIPHDQTGDERRTTYETTFHGRRWITLSLRDGIWSLYVPGHRDPIALRFDDKRTGALKADPIYAAYRRAQSDGSLTALMVFDRKGEMADREREMQAAADEVGKSCGAKPLVKVDWTSISDEDIKELSILSYCGEPLETMRRMCTGSEEAKKTFAAKLKTFVCTMGAAGAPPRFDLTGTTLTWTTTRKASNIGQLTRAYLEQNL
jgi:hypothetical protein